MSVFIITVLFVYGLIAGSFINALVWRLQQQLDKDGNPKKLNKQQRATYSISKGRSMCPSCSHILAPKDLVPLFSWLSLRGKCRYCNKPIHWQYPVVELVTALLFGLSYVFWPFVLQTNEWIIFIGFLITLVMLFALAIYDYKTYLLPNRLIYPAIYVQLATLFLFSIVNSSLDRFGWAFLAGLVFFGLFALIYFTSYYAVSHGKSASPWLGFGDVRLAFLLGLVIGTPSLVFMAIFLASIIGLVIITPKLIAKDLTMKSHVPFGPLLIIGAILTVWWGNSLLMWYTNLLIGI